MSLRDALLDRYAPSGVQVVHWLQGKPTRDEMVNYLQFTVDQLEEIKKFLVESMSDFDKKANQIFAALRLQSHQTDTLVRMIDGSSSGRQAFYAELRKTISFAEFIESLTAKRGLYIDKPVKEKIEMIRNWNKQDDVLLCDFDVLKLQSYIVDFPNEFTPEEVEALKKEFNFHTESFVSTLDVKDSVNVEIIR